MSLEQYYIQASTINSDINEHVQTLSKYASSCQSVVEFGVRGGVSTYGLLHGLTQNSSTKKQYTGVDIAWCPITVHMKEIATSNGIEYDFKQCDSAKVQIDENFDMLFIDSWHIYGHLKRELENNHKKVNKWIVMHDTTVDEIYGESIRCNWDTRQQSIQSGYPEEEIRKGLWPAIEEFLEQNKEWSLLERFTNNNGLTILEKNLKMA